MKVTLERSTAADAAAVTAVRLAAARALGAQFGAGPWSMASDTVAGVTVEVETGAVGQARADGTLLATMRLALENPWLGDTSFFTPARTAVYVTSMAVAPAHQRVGVGRACLVEVERLAQAWQATAIRLDSHDAPAGATEFYRKCGFRVVGRGSYFGTPLVWLERQLDAPAETRKRAQLRAAPEEPEGSGRRP